MTDSKEMGESIQETHNWLDEDMSQTSSLRNTQDQFQNELNDQGSITDVECVRSRLSTGKSAIDWSMERQAVTTNKDSGITNDANLWSTETMNNPRCPLELLQRVITVSLETMKIVSSLPKLEID